MDDVETSGRATEAMALDSRPGKDVLMADVLGSEGTRGTQKGGEGGRRRWRRG